jgi:tetratricopeptide (TPR) repeat protein
VASAVVSLVLGLGLHVRRQLEVAARDLVEGQKELQEHRAYAAMETLRHGLWHVEDLPFCGSVTQQLRQQLRQAEQAYAESERAKARHDLHTAAEEVRVFFGIDSLPPKVQRKLEDDCRALWNKRQFIAEQLGTARDADLRADILDIAILWADLRVRGTAGDRTAVRQDALQMLSEAERLFGSSPVLKYERQRLESSGPLDPARLPEPRTAWEHYALGRAYLHSGDHDRAAEALRRAVALQPAGRWANFYYGLCAYRQGQYEDALVAFSVCVGAARDSAACYYNRAQAYAALGRREQAVADYGQAVRLDPGLASAWLNRGILHYQEGRLTQAQADLDRALDRGANPAAAHYNLALVHLARQDRQAALASVRRALEFQPGHEEAERLRKSLQGAR